VSAVIVVFVAAALALPAAPATAAVQPVVAADVDDFEFESFDGQYYLTLDESGRARLRVVETLVALFPDYDQNRGIIRALPRHSLEYNLNPRVISVTDAAGSPVPYEVDDYDEFTEVALGTDEYEHGRTTYVIEYEMDDPIRTFDTDDEFYWDVNGDGWWQSFGTVTSTVHVDDDLVPLLTGDVSCYGGYSEKVPCELTSSDGGTTWTQSSADVGFRSTVTVAIGFEKNAVVQPQLAKDSWIVTLLPLLLVLAASVLLVFAVIVRLVVWRDAPGRGIVVAQYSVPVDLDPLLAAAIVRRPKQAMPAMLLNLAVTRSVRVIDRSPENTGDDKYDLEFIGSPAATDVDEKVLRILYSSDPEEGETVSLDRIDTRRGTELYNYATAATKRAVGKHLFEKPVGRIANWIRRLFVLVVAGHVVTWVFAIANDVAADVIVPTSFASIVLALVASGILVAPLRLTDTGADLRDHLLGVRDYIQLAEAERLRVLQGPAGAERVDLTDGTAIVKLHERLLPYAVLFGMEREWAKQLEIEYGALGENPTWLSTASSTSASSLDLGRAMAGFRAGASTNVRPPAPPPSSGGSWSGSGSSSSSGGSSGGGFSGGGSGGGGGGGR